MKASIKLAVLGLAVLGSAAQAAVINSSVLDSTGSSLVLMLKDNSNSTYLNFEISSAKVFDFDSKSYLQSVPDGKYSLDTTDPVATTGPMSVPALLNGWSNANLTAYLTSHASDSFTWTIMGSAFAPSIATAANQDLLFTSTEDHLQNYWSTSVVYNAANAFQDVIDKANAAGTNINTTFGYGSTGGDVGGLIPGTIGGPAGNGAALGQAQSIYLVASSSSDGYAANVYKSAYTLTLSSLGVLSYAAPAAVPVPAALWLLVSGLAGLVGIGRRRDVAVAA